jgi:hypothetical protein
MLLADTGAGSRRGKFQLILDEDDCLLCGGLPFPSVTLRGAFAGSYPVYVVPVGIPALGFAQDVRAVGVPSLPGRFDGIACFGFLNQFTYGNFGGNRSPRFWPVFLIRRSVWAKGSTSICLRQSVLLGKTAAKCGERLPLAIPANLGSTPGGRVPPHAAWQARPR